MLGFYYKGLENTESNFLKESRFLEKRCFGLLKEVKEALVRDAVFLGGVFLLVVWVRAFLV